jgi:N-acetylglucosaminyldiphosphoundecaprenol N-acetyl-beta-D-mannosaminyltransferase
MLSKTKILGVGITNAAQQDILEYTVKSLQNSSKKLFVVTPNPEFLVLANKNNRFKKILNRVDLALNDGVGIMVASQVLGRGLKERFTGVDFVEMVCKKVSKKPITVGFLGGSKNVAEKTAECLRSKYPGLRIGFVGQEWSSDRLRTKNKKLRTKNYQQRANNREQLTVLGSKFQAHSSIDVLFVAFGAPKQEFWIEENMDQISAKVFVGVGGAFDYISGRVKRAPKFVQQIGLEWLYRLINEPWRIKRQLALVEFVWLVMKEKLTISN